MTNKLDAQNVIEKFRNFPRQLLDGLDLVDELPKFNFNEIVLCGMGGSALPADIVNLAFEPNIPIEVHRNYGLPKNAGKKTLVICASYSGNTEETISALEEALEKKLQIICISAGGKLMELAQKHNLTFFKIPSGFQPRMASGFFFGALAEILWHLDVLVTPGNKVANAANSILTKLPKLESKGKALARKLKNEIPMVYSSQENWPIARIWKINFNENSKVPSFYNSFPELNHNEMVGFTNPKAKFHFIILEDENDNKKIKKRMTIMGRLMREKKMQVSKLQLKGEKIEKIFSSLLISCFASYYLALESGIDPAPVEMVEKFKKRLT